MKKINVCIDLDSTLTVPDYWVDYANRHFGTNYVYDDNTVEQYFIDNQFDNNKFDEFYHQYASEMHRTAKLRPYAKEVIHHLKEYCNIYYVTAREKKIEPITIEWLKENNVFSDVFHLGSFHKNDKANELNCDIFIEDNLETAKKLYKDSITVLLIDTGFNRYENPEGIIRVSDWHEINHFISNYYRNRK